MDGKYGTIYEFIDAHPELTAREIAYQWTVYRYREGLKQVPEDDDDLEDDLVYAEHQVVGYRKAMQE